MAVLTANGASIMLKERRLKPAKEREFYKEQTPYTGNLRYVHLLEEGDDVENVKRQFDEKLLTLGIPRGNVRALPGKIILSVPAYEAWQAVKEQQPGRKKRIQPELRQFHQLHDEDDDSWQHALAKTEVARIVVGTIASNAKQIYQIPDLNIRYDKNQNVIKMDSRSLATYLTAIQSKKPYLLENDSDFRRYVDTTLHAISSSSEQTQFTFNKAANLSHAQAMATFGLHAQKSSTTSRKKVAEQKSDFQSGQQDRELVPTR